MLKFDEMVVGDWYQISFTEEQHPGHDTKSYFEGTGILVERNPLNYPEGTLMFHLPEISETGYFSISDVVTRISHEAELEDDILITVDDGLFEGTRLEWANVFFSNATNQNIVDYCVEHNHKLTIIKKP